VPVCDGCGAAVDAEHIRQRIHRLELATRFRPIHINVLLIDAAPPAAPQDFFYARASAGSSGSPNPYLRELSKLAVPSEEAVVRAENWRPESVLDEFQRRGFFLTSAVECPMINHDDLAVTIRRLSPTVLRRVQSSYKPKYVALLSQPTAELIGTFRAAGWGDRLVLDNGVPFMVAADEGHPVEPGTPSGDRLVAAISRLP